MPLGDEDILNVAARVACAPCFEDGANIVLETILASAASDDVREARALLIVRTADAYRRIVALDHAKTELVRDRSLASATLWEWVAQTKAPVHVDVPLALIETAAASSISTPPASPFDATETCRRLSARGVTHIVAWPLRLGDDVVGMVCLEAACQRKVGALLLSKPMDQGIDRLALLVGPALVTLPNAPPEDRDRDDLLPVVGQSMAPLVRTLRVFATTDETLLLSGRTGAGKSRLARYCHAHSSAREGSFETLDLTSVPPDLQLAELFGWRKGAFTGAVRDNDGAIQRASNGTLFVDEIDKLSMAAQSGLLRVFEERKYRSLGDGTERTCTARFIVGTNVDLAEAVSKGTFREDLYYRVHVLPIRVPTLDERTDEIADWAEIFLRRAAAAGGIDASFEAASLEMFSHARWPGNLRQLDNVVRRALTFARVPTPASRALVVRAEDVSNALASERGLGAPKDLSELLTRAANLLVDAARASGKLDLELADAFRGFVVMAALRKSADRDQALRMLGKESAVANRNQGKVLRKELERLRELHERLGMELPEDLARLEAD